MIFLVRWGREDAGLIDARQFVAGSTPVLLLIRVVHCHGDVLLSHGFAHVIVWEIYGEIVLFTVSADCVGQGPAVFFDTSVT